MITVMKLKASDFDMITCQESMAYLNSSMSDDVKLGFERQNDSYTLINEEGRVVCCGGVVDMWGGRGELWAIFDKNCKKDFIGIFRTISRFIENIPYRRLESVVDWDFKAGHRFVEMLGFKLETPFMGAYRPGGKDCSMYVRIKK